MKFRLERRKTTITRMKTLKLLVALCVVSTAVYAGEINEADKKWSGAVEQMIVDGATTISTPNENRAKLAKELAAKHGRQAQIVKSDAGFKIVIQASKLAKQ